MNLEEKVKTLFQITFSMYTFWIIIVGFFIATTDKSPEGIQLAFSGVIIFYIISFLLFINQEYHTTNNKKILQKASCLLQFNLVLICVEIILLINTGVAEVIPAIAGMIGCLHYLLLIGIAFLIPAAVLWQLARPHVSK
jgi:hypothetical protein